MRRWPSLYWILVTLKLLLCRAECFRLFADGLHGEEVVVVQFAIEVPGKFRRLRSERRTSTLQEHHSHDLAVLRVRVGREPSETRMPSFEQVPVLPRISSSLKL